METLTHQHNFDAIEGNDMQYNTSYDADDSQRPGGRDDLEDADPIAVTVGGEVYRESDLNSIKVGKDYSKYPWGISESVLNMGGVKYQDVINFTRCPRQHHCVMCGRDGNSKCVIPAQNKDVCKDCDTSYWRCVRWNVVVKFCKGCKNFATLSDFHEKPEASKCGKCRQRGRLNYFARKKSSPSTSGSHHHISDAESQDADSQDGAYDPTYYNENSYNPAARPTRRTKRMRERERGSPLQNVTNQRVFHSNSANNALSGHHGNASDEDLTSVDSGRESDSDSRSAPHSSAAIGHWSRGGGDAGANRAGRPPVAPRGGGAGGTGTSTGLSAGARDKEANIYARTYGPAPWLDLDPDTPSLVKRGRAGSFAGQQGMRGPSPRSVSFSFTPEETGLRDCMPDSRPPFFDLDIPKSALQEAGSGSLMDLANLCAAMRQSDGGLLSPNKAIVRCNSNTATPPAAPTKTVVETKHEMATTGAVAAMGLGLELALTAAAMPGASNEQREKSAGAQMIDMDMMDIEMDVDEDEDGTDDGTGAGAGAAECVDRLVAPGAESPVIVAEDEPAAPRAQTETQDYESAPEVERLVATRTAQEPKSESRFVSSPEAQALLSPSIPLTVDCGAESVTGDTDSSTLTPDSVQQPISSQSSQL